MLLGPDEKAANLFREALDSPASTDFRNTTKDRPGILAE